MMTRNLWPYGIITAFLLFAGGLARSEHCPHLARRNL